MIKKKKKRLKRRTCEHYTQLNVVSLYRKSLKEGVRTLKNFVLQYPSQIVLLSSTICTVSFDLFALFLQKPKFSDLKLVRGAHSVLLSKMRNRNAKDAICYLHCLS